MTRSDCSHEQTVVSVVMARGWPGAADEELQAHVRACPVCADVVEVATLLRMDHETFGREIRLPAAGQVWWRAAVRARMEAAHAAARPITWLQGVAAACAGAVACAVLAFTWPSVREVAGWFAQVAIGLDPSLSVIGPVRAAVEQSLPLVLSVAALVVLGPLVVLYFALSGEGRE